VELEKFYLRKCDSVSHNGVKQLRENIKKENNNNVTSAEIFKTFKSRTCLKVLIPLTFIC